MAKADVLSKLYAKRGTALEFNYDRLIAPPMFSMVRPIDLEYLYKIITSIRYTSRLDYKEAEIKKVMEANGWKRYASGTHRVVYRNLDHPAVVAKIALNKSSLGDNIREMYNQVYLKPFCCKCFEVQYNGLIATFERVEEISSMEEFKSLASDIFDFLNTKILGKYVVDDIGTASFMNYGIRKAGRYSDISFGPVLLDYAEVYPLDGNKLYCNKVDPKLGIPCGGQLDYDEGFNVIHCTRCGCKYSARDLQLAEENHEIIKKGADTKMKILVKRGDKVIKTIDSRNTATRTIEPPKKKSSGLTLAHNPKPIRNGKKKVNLPKDKNAMPVRAVRKPDPEPTPVPVNDTFIPQVPVDIPEWRRTTDIKSGKKRYMEFDAIEGFSGDEEPEVTEAEEAASIPAEDSEPTESEENYGDSEYGNTEAEAPADVEAEINEDPPAEDEASEEVGVEGELGVEDEWAHPAEGGDESYDAESELGGSAEAEDPITDIDPAAIAAQMMGAGINPFAR